MKVIVFSTKPYDRRFLEAANADRLHEFHYLEPRLTAETSPLAAGYPAVCAFVNDMVDREALKTLAVGKTKFVALRCSGFNQVDLSAAAEFGVQVARVPAYSPYAVAEHTLGLILALNRRIHHSYNRVRELNFSLDGLLGFDLHGRTAGVIGTGRIGELVCTRLQAFGCRVIAYDVSKNPQCEAIGVEYVEINELFRQSDIVSLHCPLVPQTKHLINAETLSRMKPGVMLINTSRGGLVDTQAVIQALKRQQIGYLGLDVYEEEAETFFTDHSRSVLQDDVLARLLTFPNVIITGHQAFFTQDALQNIAQTTVENLTAFEQQRELVNEVSA